MEVETIEMMGHLPSSERDSQIQLRIKYRKTNSITAREKIGKKKEKVMEMMETLQKISK